MSPLRAKSKAAVERKELQKAPTGIDGLDQITGGGLPRGRPTLICGGPGCGKTLMSMEFLVKGATLFDEPGVHIAFEETPEELAQNVASLGFDVAGLVRDKKLYFDHIKIDANEVEETGDFDLEGLFIRIGLAIDSVNAKRIVLDTIETLFAGLTNEAILRSELIRLFRWLKDRGVTAIVTGERGEGQLTRQGMEEYVSDCVILLDHRVTDQLSTRRLRIVKYRGTTHGTNEYPFLIQETGVSVLPITSIGLKHDASSERVSTGVPRLDTMLEGKGYYRGTSILVSGQAGTGKTTFAARFAEAACQRGEKCVYFAFEESERQIVRNMRSVGIDLDTWIKRGLLHVFASRPTFSGLEAHLVSMHKHINDLKPRIVVVDPLSNFMAVGSALEANSLLIRLIDFLKSEQITGFFTDLTAGHGIKEQTEVQVSSIIDTWIQLRSIELAGERNRAIYILKSRGMEHSNQIREVRFSDKGIELIDVYIGPEGVLTGAMRASQEAKERALALELVQAQQRKQLAIEAKRKAIEGQIRALESEFESLKLESEMVNVQAVDQAYIVSESRKDMGRRRGIDVEMKDTNGRGAKAQRGKS
ncbi:MAG: circadian clock protein KaiC [Candidatus Hydrogenedentes bacterium]|nr:circadian clock protein KaiC [Candidatus Hydrogenedentota bacterium]